MTHPDASTWNILLVDDDESNRTVIALVLRFYDAVVAEAGSGKEALRILEQRSDFNLGLFDIQMSGISGWQLLKEIRAHPRSEVRDMPIIAVTALAMRGDRERILAAGFDGYLVKPLDPDKFLQDIANILATYKEKRKHEPTV
jgi:two-component system, cell cycle response regulator DivK